jgi:hypothetical protein
MMNNKHHSNEQPRSLEWLRNRHMAISLMALASADIESEKRTIATKHLVRIYHVHCAISDAFERIITAYVNAQHSKEREE